VGGWGEGGGGLKARILVGGGNPPARLKESKEVTTSAFLEGSAAATRDGLGGGEKADFLVFLALSSGIESFLSCAQQDVTLGVGPRGKRKRLAERFPNGSCCERPFPAEQDRKPFFPSSAAFYWSRDLSGLSVPPEPLPFCGTGVTL